MSLVGLAFICVVLYIAYQLICYNWITMLLALLAFVWLTTESSTPIEHKDETPLSPEHQALADHYNRKYGRD